MIVYNFEMVRMERLELSLPKEPDFESGASTNSTTSALKFTNQQISKAFL